MNAEYLPNPSAAGGCYSTLRDMLNWSRGLQSHKVVSKDMLRRMTSSQVAHLSPEMDYGYGFELTVTGDVHAWGHGGIASGVNSEFRYFPDSDMTLILFCNQDNAAFDDLKRHTVTLISRVTE